MKPKKRETLKSWLRNAGPYLKRCFFIEGKRLTLKENLAKRGERRERGKSQRR